MGWQFFHATPTARKSGAARILYLLLAGHIFVFTAKPVLAQRPIPEQSAQPARIDPWEEKAGDAVNAAALFLRSWQNSDGSWQLNREKDVKERTTLESKAAATGLSLLALMADQRRNKADDKAIRHGLNYLRKSQKKDGDYFVSDSMEWHQVMWLYSHAVAAKAMCRAWQETGDERWKASAEKAIAFSVAAQQVERGGWRYHPGHGSDTSVTAWVVQSLVTAQNVGLDVPMKTIDGANRWFSVARGEKELSHLFRYNPYAPDTLHQRHGRTVNPTMSAAALACQLQLGAKTDDRQILLAADYLLQHLPQLGKSGDPQRDAYYWYYGTLAMSQIKGQRQQKWRKALYPLILDRQIAEGPLAGSWDPMRPIPDRWAAHAGRIYVTAMHVLTLEAGRQNPR